VVPSPGGDISAFLNDPLFAQQCFIISEPLQARRAGAGVAVFPVADIGYNPYTTVLATRGAMLRESLETARAMVQAVRDGWQRYLDDPRETNDRMHDLNPTMDPETFAETAEQQKPFILTDDARTAGLGTMTAERWDKLIGQLYSLGDITEPLAAAGCFRAL
jgi:NitT/TauT family transport system substrate-binding protein